jgi:hypothetical protein
MTYTPDGGVIASGVPRSQREPDEHTRLFGLYKGVVIRAIYPDDPDNSSGKRMEYVVKVRGQLYPNAISMKKLGGIFNRSERVLKQTEKSFSGQVTGGTYDEDLDGEHVYVLFVEGHGNVPVIIGNLEHPRAFAVDGNRFSREDGVFEVEEFQGVEFGIDNDSNFLIRGVGRKDPSGKILNPNAKGALLRLGGEFGDWLMKSARGALFYMDKTGSIRLIAEDGATLTYNAEDNTVIMAQKDGNVISLTPDEISIVGKGGGSAIKIDDDGVTLIGDKLIGQGEEFSFNVGTVNLGTLASYRAVLYENMKSIFDSHTQMTAMGPTSPPIPPYTMALKELIPTDSAAAEYVNLRGNI